MLKNIRLAFVGLAVLAGCNTKEQGNFDCAETGVVLNSGSNWVFAIDTASGMQLATKYPIVLRVEILDTHLNRMDSFEDSIDSGKLSGLPVFADSLRKLKMVWVPLDKNGKAVASGCYKAVATVRALEPILTEGDIPSDVGTEITMEWKFSFIRDMPE